jgi:hypothetical protein
MNEERFKLLEARIEAYKNLIGAQTALALTGDTDQERLAQQAANELKETIEEEHDLE